MYQGLCVCVCVCVCAPVHCSVQWELGADGLEEQIHPPHSLPHLVAKEQEVKGHEYNSLRHSHQSTVMQHWVPESLYMPRLSEVATYIIYTHIVTHTGWPDTHCTMIECGGVFVEGPERVEVSHECQDSPYRSTHTLQQLTVTFEHKALQHTLHYYTTHTYAHTSQ